MRIITVEMFKGEGLGVVIQGRLGKRTKRIRPGILWAVGILQG